MMLVLNISTVAIVWFGSIRIDSGEMQVGALIAFLQYAMQILFAMLMVSVMFIMLPRAAASATRINAVWTWRRRSSRCRQGAACSANAGYVEFEDVTFSYPGAEEPALSHISFSAQPGQVTAIIGGTGAGKSTLVDLIPRFYDVDSGRVLVDGVDVREMTQAELRAKIGSCRRQRCSFRAPSPRTSATATKTPPMTRCATRLRSPRRPSSSSEMGDGFDSVIAQGGTNVSGGQKQRLSIARALVRQTGDLHLRRQFLRAGLSHRRQTARRVAGARPTDATVLIVAQRVSTIMDADQIIVLDEGRIVASARTGN